MVSVFETERNGQRYLQFDFGGYLQPAQAQIAIDQWKSEMKPGIKNHLIFNCAAMTGFDTEARRVWQDAMSKMKPQIGSIWIVSTNVFILGAARTMGLLTGFNIKTQNCLTRFRTNGLPTDPVFAE